MVPPDNDTDIPAPGDNDGDNDDSGNDSGAGPDFPDYEPHFPDFPNEPDFNSEYADAFSDILESIDEMARETAGEFDAFDTIGEFGLTVPSLLQETSDIPSAVTNENSIFERHTEILRGLFAQDKALPRNDGSHSRLADLVSETFRAEKAARNAENSPKMGEYARAAEKGYLGSGQNKCNLHVGEHLRKAGMDPMLLTNKNYANTKAIVDNPKGFKCWRPSDSPKRGDVFVHHDGKYGHMGVVTGEQTNNGISAGKTWQSKRMHFAKDKNGVQRAIKSTQGERFEQDFNKHAEVIFMEYYCPDHEPSGIKIKDE